MAIETKDLLGPGSGRPSNSPTRRVVVRRPFFHQGAPTKVGDVLEVSKAFAAELIHGNKAELGPAEPAKANVTEAPPQGQARGPLAGAARPVQTRSPRGGE